MKDLQKQANDIRDRFYSSNPKNPFVMGDFGPDFEDLSVRYVLERYKDVKFPKHMRDNPEKFASKSKPRSPDQGSQQNKKKRSKAFG